jgi:hypothetical protein
VRSKFGGRKKRKRKIEINRARGERERDERKRQLMNGIRKERDTEGGRE